MGNLPRQKTIGDTKTLVAFSSFHLKRLKYLGWEAVCAISARRGRGFPPTGGRERGLCRHETHSTEPKAHSGRTQLRPPHGTKKSPTAMQAAFRTHSTEPKAHSGRTQLRPLHGTKKSPTNEQSGRNKGAFFATGRKRTCFV